MNSPPRTDHKAYIFVTSPNPDPYINAIAAIHSKHGPARIWFVQITGGTGDYPGDVPAAVRHRLTELSQGRYENPPHPTAEIPVEGRQLYSRILDAINSYGQIHNIPISELDESIAAFSKSDLAVFDITAVRKDYLVDIVALLTSRGITKIGYFHLAKKPTYDEGDMIHALTPGAYDYIDISSSENIELVFERIERRSWLSRILISCFTGVAILALGLQFTGTSSTIYEVVQVAGLGLGIVAGLVQIKDFMSGPK